MSRNKNSVGKAIGGLGWLSFSSIITALVRLVITIIISRLLNASEIGVVASIQIVISFAEIFWMLGVTQAIIQKQDLNDKDLNTGFFINFLLGIFIYLLLIILANPIAEYLSVEDKNMIQVLSLVFVFHSISGLSEALLFKNLKFKFLSIINLLDIIIYGVSATIFAFLGFGAWSLIYSMIIQSFSRMILLFIFSPIKLSLKFSLDSFKKLIFFGSGYTLSRLLNNLANQGDYLVVNRTLGNIQLGYYNRAYKILMVPTNLVGQVLEKILFPFMSLYQDRKEKLNYALTHIIYTVAIFAFPISAISFLMAEDLVYLVLGPNWESVIIPFKILILSLFFRIAYKISDSLIQSLGKVYLRTYIQFVYAAMIIFGALYAVKWGLLGVSISVAISISLNFFVTLFVIKKLTNYKATPLIKDIVLVLILNTFIAFVIYHFLDTITLVNSSMLRFLIITIIFYFLYFICLIIYYKVIFSKDYKEFLNLFFTNLLKKIRRKS
jgi:PST family polysaccharide transporter